MPLNGVTMGKYAQVDSINGTEIMCKKIMEMGVNRGMILQMLRNDAGSIIIKVGETRLVIGRGIAQKVIVRELKI